MSAGEAQVLEQRRHVGLVAAHAVKRLGQHNLKPAALRVLQQRLNTGTENHAGAGNGGVVIGADDLPVLARRMLAADAELILDKLKSVARPEFFWTRAAMIEDGDRAAQSMEILQLHQYVTSYSSVLSAVLSGFGAFWVTYKKGGRKNFCDRP
jgi:hypothetical protein